MRILNSAIVLTVCLALVCAQQQQQDQQQQQQPVSETPTASDKTQDDPTQYGPPNDMTPEQIDLAKHGISQILAKLPIQQLDPLVTSMDGYCTAFSALCAAACKERVTPENKGDESAVAQGCLNPAGATLGEVAASCKCASMDLTERVNFAVAGGFMSSQNAQKGDFASEGILDILTFIPAVPGFLSVIHVLQNICYYVSFLDVLATNPHPNSSCPVSPNGPLGIVSSIPVLGPLLAGLLGGLVKGAPTPAPLPGPFDWLFPPKKTPTPSPTPTPTPSHVPSIFELIGDLFKPKHVTTTITTITTTTKTSALLKTATPTHTPTTAPKVAAAAGNFMSTLVDDIEQGLKNLIPASENDESAKGGAEADKEEWASEDVSKMEKVKAKHHDSRVSRSARAQRRHAEKAAKDQDRNDL
ncbi:hypothetical protein BGZ70_000512 [Mortierella alpina]|uniref:Extracellular membrane protein CFEM domain-containing protein n=1 Tax=Mortierella alpina TaxID=64518 RepID=A0A9P6JF20_MORAP|nr:hypothetical protein BGZ70_000512 [Mortierella alpina]